MASYEVYLYKQRHDWDTVYDRVLSNYKLAYAHRDDPGESEHSRAMAGI